MIPSDRVPGTAVSCMITLNHYVRRTVMKSLLWAGLRCALVLVLGIAAAEAQAYEILLDIDTDGDPTTINEVTPQTDAVVRMILQPSEPGELFVGATFGLGGSCVECEHVQHYGTAHDLLGDDWSADWTEVETLAGWGTYATYLGCADNPTYHLLLTVEPLADHLLLTEPMFIATFNVWRADPTPPSCQQPPSNLAAMFGQGRGGYWNYVQIGGPASIGSTCTSWTALKKVYR